MHYEQKRFEDSSCPVPPEEAGREITNIDGHTLEELGELVHRHDAELLLIPGFVYSGIDRQGIFFGVESRDGNYPAQIEGVPVHLHKAAVAVRLGQ